MKKIIFIIVLILELFIIFNTKEVIKEFTLTLNICIYSILPTLFFQIMFSNFLYNMDISKYIPIKICDVFNINKEEASIILLSMFSGYPNNIKFLKESNNEYLNYVSNYINPLFLVGTVGAVYLNNIRISLIILLCHILSNLIMLFILKNKYTKTKIINKEAGNIYSESLNNTISTISIIIFNLLFISLFISILKITIPKNINTYLIGIIEFSRGIYEISYMNLNIYLKGLLILIIITFGSINIHFQIITINNKIKYIKFLLYRLLNVLISILLYFIILFIISNV